MRHAVLIALVSTLVAGCASSPSNGGKVRLTSNVAYTYEELAVAPVVAWSLRGILENTLDELPLFRQPLLLYFVYQPFAPNWEIEEARLDDKTYYLRMQAKRFRTGGDGEAVQLLRRRALQLQHERGFTGYRILDYSEGIESGTPVAQRYSHGIVQLVRADGEVPKEKSRP